MVSYDERSPPFPPDSQGKAKQTRKFAAVKRMIKPSDPRLYVARWARLEPYCPSRVADDRKENIEKAAKKAEKDKQAEERKQV